MTVPGNCTTTGSVARWTRWLAVAAALLLLASACAGSSDDGDDASTAEDAPAAALSMSQDSLEAAPEEMADEEMMDTEEEAREVRLTSGAAAEEDMSDESGTSTLAAGVPAVPADLGRDIIYTAWIAVETADVAAAAAQANSIIEGLGGFAFSQDTRTQDRAYTTLTFKVRPEQFSTALERLSNVGELVEQSVNAEDVSDIVVDLNSRISTAEVSVKRLREFLSQATDAKGVAELERELASRETNLERLRGQLRSLRDRVDLATITLSITESVEAVPETSVILRAWMAAGDDDPCLGFTELAAPPDGDVGFCFELENDGETVLTEVTLTSRALRFQMDQLHVLGADDGVDIARIEPGQRRTAKYTEQISGGRIGGRVATRGLEIDVRLSAVPVTETGTELARLARSHGLYLHVEEEDTPPSFGDALSGGWGALVSLATGIGLVVVALLAWLPVIAVVLWVAWWWLRRRRARRAAG